MTTSAPLMAVMVLPLATPAPIVVLIVTSTPSTVSSLLPSRLSSMVSPLSALASLMVALSFSARFKSITAMVELQKRINAIGATSPGELQKALDERRRRETRSDEAGESRARSMRRRHHLSPIWKACCLAIGDGFVRSGNWTSHKSRCSYWAEAYRLN